MAVKAKEEKVIYSEIESTVHVNIGEPEVLPDGKVYQAHTSKILLPGDTITLEEVPSYFVDLVNENKAPGLILIDRSEANRLNEFAKLARGEAKITDFAKNNAPEENLDTE